MTKKRILILGGSGRVSEAVYRLFNSTGNYDFTILSQYPTILEKEYDNIEIQEADYTKPRVLRNLIYKAEPEIIINGAAVTNVDLCEKDKNLAQAINTNLVDNLVKASAIKGYHLITFSTDYIFDGKSGPYTEDAIPNPINYYGKTKLAAENLITTSNIKYTIIRTNVVYGFSSFRKFSFIDWVYGILSINQPIEVIDGQWGNPTFADDIARAVQKIIEKDRTGIYNIAGPDYLNRYEIALKVAEVYGFDSNLVIKVPESQLKQKARRPHKGGLVPLKAETDLNMKFSGLISGINATKFKYESYNLKKALYD